MICKLRRICRLRFVMVAILFLTADAIAQTKTHTWIPDERSEQPEVAIIGPIVDPDRTGISNNQRFFIKMLDGVIKRLTDTPDRYLPASYIRKIRKIKRQRWNPADNEEFITEEEENQMFAWLEIVGDGTALDPGLVMYRGEEFDADNVEIANKLKYAYGHIRGKKSGLELAVRLNLDKSDFETSLLIDGYRLSYNQDGTAKAEWYAVPVSIRRLSDEDVEKKLYAVVGQQLILPFFEQFTEEFSPTDRRLGLWTTDQVPGYIDTRSQPFEMESTPITEQFAEECHRVGWCREADSDDGFALIDSEREAIKYCKDRRKHLLRKSLLPFLYQKYSEILEDRFIWVEDSMYPLRILEGDYDFFEIEEGDTNQASLVWCRQNKSNFLSEIEEIEQDTILRKRFGSVHWYNAQMAKREGYLFSHNGNHIEVTGYNEKHPSIAIGKILLESEEPLEEGSKIYYDYLTDDFIGLSFGIYTSDFILRSVDSEELLINAPVYRIYYTSGHRYSGYTWSVGLSMPGLGFSGKTEAGDDIEITVHPGFFYDHVEVDSLIQSLSGEFGVERPTYLITDLSWRATLGLDMLSVRQETKYANSARGEDKVEYVGLATVFAGIKLNYKFGGYSLFGGVIYSSGAKAPFNDSDYFSEVEMTSSEKMYFGAEYIFE